MSAAARIQAEFRGRVLEGYRAAQPAGLGVDVEVDVSGADRDEALRRVVGVVY